MESTPTPGVAMKLALPPRRRPAKGSQARVLLRLVLLFKVMRRECVFFRVLPFVFVNQGKIR